MFLMNIDLIGSSSGLGAAAPTIAQSFLCNCLKASLYLSNGFSESSVSYCKLMVITSLTGRSL